jgi:hypothetical protein
VLSAAVASLVFAVTPASSVIDNDPPRHGDVLLETLTVQAGVTTPVETTTDFSPDNLYTLVFSGTVRSYNQSRTDAPPATHDAFYCMTGCEDPCSFEPCNRNPVGTGALTVKSEYSFGGSDRRADDFKPIGTFLHGPTGDEPEYRPSHQYSVRFGDPVFYRPAGHLFFVDGIPPRADRPSSGAWKVEIWGHNSPGANRCTPNEKRESIPMFGVTATWKVSGKLRSKGTADFIRTPTNATKPPGSKRDFYGDTTGTSCFKAKGRAFELVHLPEEHAEWHDGPRGMKGIFFFRVSETTDPGCPKGSDGELTLFDARQPGLHDTAKLVIDRPCAGRKASFTSGVNVTLTVKRPKR